MSTQPCGCDPEERWICERHKGDLKTLLASIDEWLGNDDPASEVIDMIIEWREVLATALGEEPRS